LIGAGAGGMAASLTPGSLARQATPAGGNDAMAGDVLTALQRSRAWINYGAARPFDFQIGKSPVSEDQLRLELEMLFTFGFRGLVTNAVTYGMEAAPRIAKETGFQHAIAKLWWPDEETFALEKQNLAAEIDHIDAIVVGNEPVHKAIFRGDSGEWALARLRAEIEDLQQAYGKPVTTGLHRDEWILYPEMATDLGDWVFPNLQPWWAIARNNPETAAAWVEGVYESIRTTPGMPKGRVVVAQEAAYPTSAVPPELAPGATPENQVIFFERLIESGIPFVYGFSFDAWFAQESSPPGGFGGLWDDERQPKPVVEILDLGPYA
jgi:exo-beta-1,3-glucanase (GH17 family)